MNWPLAGSKYRARIQETAFRVCIVAAKGVAVALEACACVAAGIAVDEPIGAVYEQAVCLGGTAFASDGGSEVAIAVGMQLGGAAHT